MPTDVKDAPVKDAEAKEAAAAVTPRDAMLAEYGADAVEVDRWKARFHKIESIVLGGDMYIYRAMTRMEWRELAKMQLEDRSAVEEHTANKCVLFPKDFSMNSNIGLAGVPATIADLIMTLSGFGATEQPVRL